jgi:hypothetical protein
MLNAASFLATAVWRWRPAARPGRELANREAFLRTIQVGLQYAGWSDC